MLLCGLLIAGLGACGGDDDDTDASDSGSDTKQDDSGLDAAAPTASAEFCEGFHNLDLAFATAPEDPAQMEAFVTEQVTPNVALVEANAPTEIDASITTMVGAVEQVTTSGDFSAFETPEFTEAQEEVYPYLPEGCGWAEMETTAVDFSYEGMPETAEAGTVVITMANDERGGRAPRAGPGQADRRGGRPHRRGAAGAAGGRAGAVLRHGEPPAPTSSPPPGRSVA